MKAFITGISGFVGSHLAEWLLSQGHEVHGLVRPGWDKSKIEPFAERLHLHTADLLDFESLRRSVRTSAPERVYHLAAQANVAASMDEIEITYRTNVIGQLNLLEAIRLEAPSARVHIAGSSDEYGIVGEADLPVSEDAVLRPVSPYAVSKVAQDLMGYQFYKNFGIFIVRTRAFNHSGPRRDEFYASSSFAKQIVLIERGKQDAVVKVGNLEVLRDFTDVRDVVRAYALLLDKGEAGEVYNVCSGKGISIRSILDTLLSFSRSPIKVQSDPGRWRQNDIVRMVGDPKKIFERTGWRAEIKIEKTLEDLLNDWRKRL